MIKRSFGVNTHPCRVSRTCKSNISSRITDYYCLQQLDNTYFSEKGNISSLAHERRRRVSWGRSLEE